MKIPSPLLRRLSLGALGLVLVVALAFVVLRAGPLAPIRVTVVRATVASLSSSLFGIGTVEARRAYLIGPTVAGRVSKVWVDVGDAVQAGAVLAEMDPVDLDERAAALEASIARAGSSIGAAQAQRRDAHARADLAASALRRYRELGAQAFISAGAVEAKQQEQDSAAAALAAADANLAAARQEVQRLMAERAGLRQQRDKLRLLAPSTGLVVSREAEAGSTVVAGQAVVRMIEPTSLWIRLRLDQGRSSGLALGLPASIELRSNPGTRLPGKVARVETTSDSITEERVAMVTLDALPSGLSTGEQAEVTLTLPASAPALWLPNAAIQRQADRVGVWQVEGGKPRFVPVRLGRASLDGKVQVLEGLADGAEVVVFSEKALAAGRRIKIVDSLVSQQP